MNRVLACRVCLAYDTRLCSIMDDQFRDIYEKLVQASLDTEDMLPTSVCYICFSFMKKILQFRDRSQKANQILQQMISSGLEPSVSSLDMLLKDQTGISWTLGLSNIERTTSSSGKVEVTVKLESVKSDMDIDGISDRNEDYSDCMPVYRDTTSDSENELPLQNTSKQCQTNHIKIVKTLKVILKKISVHEGAAQPQKRKLDKNEANNELVNIQAPLRKTDGDEEPRERKEDNKKIPDLKKRCKKIKSPLKTILKKTETNTSNIISKIQNYGAFNENDTVTPPKDIFTCDLCKNEYHCKILLKTHINKSHVVELNRKGSINSDLNVTNKCKSANVLKVQEILNNDNLTETKKCEKDLKNSSKGKRYQCRYCMKRYSSNNYLSAHLKFHTKKNLYKCKICKKSFTRSSALSIHLGVHTDEKTFKCDVCKKGFSLKGTLTRHLRTHTKEKPFKCQICDKLFSQTSNLTAHLRYHTKEKPFKCNTCEKGFTTRGDLTRHNRIHSGDKPHRCSYCDKTFSDRCNLIQHLRVHTKDKPYKCYICEKKFASHSNLGQHLRVHRKPYKCDICDKRFTHSDDIIKHLRVHIRRNPYKCDKCEKGFPSIGDLTKHLRVHTREKPYKCDICEKCFSQKAHLNTHLTVHTKEKPFKCDVCGKSYSRNYQLTTHKRIHSDGKN